MIWRLNKAVPVHAGKVLNLALTFAVKKKWLKRSPLRDQPMRVPRHHAEIRIPTIHDLRALLEATETRARYEPVHAFENRRAFIKLAIYTGMRRGEMAALRWEHINFVDGIVEVRHSRSMYDGLKLPKNEERGVGDVPMARELYEALRVTTYSRVGAAFFAYRCHSVASTETACFRHFAWWRGWSMRQYMRQKTKNETEVVD